jgi:methane monooxygenase component A beta chain/propane monooxygenase small subunit
VNPHIAPSRKPLSSRRNFTWYTPAERFPTEYEDLTVHQQSSPLHYAFQGWPIRFDDGRAPLTESSTRVRSSDWYAYRDPSQTIQRQYVENADAVERALAQATAGARAAGLLREIDPRWIECLEQHVMTYPFVDQGLFLAFCYAEREALSDTATLSIVFSAAERLRHLQDLVHYASALAEELPAFSDQYAMEMWKNTPVWQGARCAVEHLVACRDWMEIVVAANLCFEPIFARLVEIEYFSRFASAHGDTVTPAIMATWAAEAMRTERWTGALVEHLLDDARHGTQNREIIRDWIRTWDAHALRAIEAFAPVFEHATVQPVRFEDARERVLARRRALLDDIGLAD